MTREEAIKIIQNEYKCVDRECDIEKSCGKCPYMIPTKEPILQAYKMAIQALSQEPCDECQNKRTSFCGNCKEYDEYEQEPTFDDECQKDMDEAWEQIQKKRKRIPVTLDLTPCDDAISREDALMCLTGMFKLNKNYNPEELIALFSKRIKALPSVTQKSGKCKNCKYFEYDSVAKVDGIPLIVAHEICNKWGDGCKTKEDGYCYLFEPQERSE